MRIIQPLKRVVLFPNPYNPKMASAVISKRLAETIGAEYWQSAEDIRYEPIDELYYFYGMSAFSQFRDEMALLPPYIKKYIYCENDFMGCHLSQIRKPLRDIFKVDPYVLTTVPRKLTKVRGSYIDWNSLVWNPVDKVVPISARRTDCLMYYGTHRKDRVNYFKKFFGTDRYKIVISCGDIQKKTFAEYNSKIEFLSRKEETSINGLLSEYAASLYIEDNYSHKNFSSLPTRFYECVGAGTPMFVERNASASFTKAGLKVKEEWIVDGPKDIVLDKEFLTRMQKEQRELWYRDYLSITQKIIKGIVHREIKGVPPMDEAVKRKPIDPKDLARLKPHMKGKSWK